MRLCLRMGLGHVSSTSARRAHQGIPCACSAHTHAPPGASGSGMRTVAAHTVQHLRMEAGARFRRHDASRARFTCARCRFVFLPNGEVIEMPKRRTTVGPVYELSREQALDVQMQVRAAGCAYMHAHVHVPLPRLGWSHGRCPPAQASPARALTAMIHCHDSFPLRAGLADKQRPLFGPRHRGLLQVRRCRAGQGKHLAPLPDAAAAGARVCAVACCSADLCGCLLRCALPLQVCQLRPLRGGSRGV